MSCYLPANNSKPFQKMNISSLRNNVLCLQEKIFLIKNYNATNKEGQTSL